MRVTVVVPFRDVERHIVRCLGALVAQDPPDGGYEIILVDDASTDRSRMLAARFPAVRILQAPRTGPYAARNLGIAAAAGEIVALTDGDCEPSADWLQQIARRFEDPELCVLVGPRLPGHDSFGLALVGAYERAKDEFVFGGGRTDLYYASANNMAVRRGVFDEVGAFEERRRGADTLYVRRVAEVRSPRAVRYAPELRVRHLEVDSLGAYYRKLLSYGRSMRRLDRSSGRALRSHERLAIWRAAVRRDRLSTARAAAALVALGGGAVCWGLGSISASLTAAFRR